MKPVRINAENGKLSAVEFEKTALDETQSLKGSGQFSILKTDQVFKAIGQNLHPQDLPLIEKGKIKVNDKFQTSMLAVYAGGDCVGIGEDLTVTAVQHGKLAALSIHESLQAGGRHG
jgi:glutamate synthase (NADPH/NADH) small chain